MICHNCSLKNWCRTLSLFYQTGPEMSTLPPTFWTGDNCSQGKLKWLIGHTLLGCLICCQSIYLSDIFPTWYFGCWYFHLPHSYTWHCQKGYIRKPWLWYHKQDLIFWIRSSHINSHFTLLKALQRRVTYSAAKQGCNLISDLTGLYGINNESEALPGFEFPQINHY